MRQKPLQWLLRRVWEEGQLGRIGLGSRVWNGGAAEPGVGALGFTRPFSGVVRGRFGLEEGFGSVKRFWDFGASRAYAAPVVAGASRSKAGGGDGNKADRKINRAIVARMIRLVGEEGHEILSRYEALNRAQQAGLDLVEVDGKADPPVCKLMDFSKERFKVKKQEKDLRKKHLERRRLDDLKEVRFSSRTEQKDLEMKAETVTRLLVRGHRVKLAVQFHGNDKGEEVGVELLERAMSLLLAEVKVENGPRVEKMRAWVMIRPIQDQKIVKKKASKIIQENVDVADHVDEGSNLKAVEV